MLLANHLRRAHERAPNRVGLVAGSESWTFSQFDDEADRIAASFLSLGIERGDRIALQLSNSAELVLSYYACFKIGAIAVPINNRFAKPELEYTLNHSASRLCISQPDLYEGLAQIRPQLKSLEHVFIAKHDNNIPSGTRSFSELHPSGEIVRESPKGGENSDEVAAILYTSGTTSRPKGVTHTHRSLDATVRFHGGQIGLGDDDVVCVVPPMCHILGFATQMLAAVWAAAKMVIVPKSDAESILRTIKEHQATRFAALPVLLQAMNNFPEKSAYRMPQVRTICAGGDAVPVPVQEKFLENFGAVVQEGCGMTEVIPFTLNLPHERRLGSIGRVCPGMEIRLVDDSERDVPTGAVGEMWVRSDANMIGYWQEPEISAATIRDGFVRTGDLGRVDADGFYWFMGRKKEIIIRGGSNISPLEVEELIYQHPAVRECGVVGVPDTELGEVVWAYIALLPGTNATAVELTDFLREKIAPYKVPERIELLPELPKGSTGKVHRRTLRERAIQQRSQISNAD